jgi:hypothetical protein
MIVTRGKETTLPSLKVKARTTANPLYMDSFVTRTQGVPPVHIAFDFTQLFQGKISSSLSILHKSEALGLGETTTSLPR